MILAVLMIFGSAPQIVSAMMTEEAAVCEEENCEEHFHEEEITETAEVTSVPEGKETEEISEETAEETVLYEAESISLDSANSVSEAALALREKMIARESPVTIRVAEGILPSEVLAKAWEHNGTPNEGDYIRHNQIGHSYTTVSGEDENGAYTEITYTFNWLTTAEQEAEVDAAVDAVLAELNLWGKTDYEKIKGAYDWITENVQYDFNNEDNDEYTLCHSTYAAIVQKEAVCQGYATLFYRMMLELGVDSRYIRGMAGYVEIESHAWNIVALDGKYYNMDATWDRDLMGHYRMFLCTEANFTEHIPDSEYTTAEWKAKYPMAVVPYVFNVAASGKLPNGMEWVLDGDTGTLTVAGKGAIPSYRYNYAPWYNYKDSVKSIVISEGITEVGERAFYWCVNCTSLSLPSTLTAIREYGFNNLRNLEYVTLPENLRIMEFCAFSECVALKEIVIPDSVTTCGTSVFSNCYGLKKAVIGNGLKVIPDSMFFADKNLREVTLPDGLTEIGDTAFADCGLFYFTIPASLRTLGSSVFSGCRNLYDFTVDSGNQYYKAIGGVLFTKDGKTLVSYPGGDIASYYYVPNGTVTIARSAFNEAYRLEHVYFPDSLREIKPYAFAYCNALWSVTFTPNITRIGDSAFRSCKGLYSAIFENPDVVLEASVFADCDTMEFIYLPSRLREIPNGLFYGSQRLSEVTIPSTVTKIGSSAFLDCDSLRTITVPGTVKSVEQQAFDYCDKLETIIFEEGVQRIGWLAIRNNPKLKKVVIPSSVTTFERPSGTSDKTFDACPNVVVYVNCGTAGWNYVRNYGISYSASHPYTNSTVVQPTCTSQGYTRYYCNCGTYSYNSNYTSALGHSYNSYVTPPTCTEEGYTTYTCRRCGYSYNGNYVPENGHSLVLTGYVEPTCTEPGYSGDEVCSVCGTTYYGEEIPETGHFYDGYVTPPTCTEQGYTEYICLVCGESYIENYVPALGHTEVIDKAVAPTCTETGLTEGKHCSVCGEILVKQNVVPALGHTEVVDKAVAPTCTETGLTEGKHCSVCGEILVKQNVVPALGHTEVIDEAVAPTCTETGLTEGKHCSVCGEILVKQNVVPALGHTEVIDKAVAPTCTETGLTEGKHCSVCGEVLVKQNVVPALGHNYESVITEPTCTEQGYTTHTCSICGENYIDSYVEAKGHSFGEWNEITAPTCDNAGQDKQVCSVCGGENYRKTYISGDSGKILVENPLPVDYFEGKKIVTLGDSITQGVGLSDPNNEYYGKLVADALGMSAINKGVSGSGYCSGGAMSTNKTLTEKNIKDADIVTILLGVNDWDWAVKDGFWKGEPGYYDENQTYYQLGEPESTDTSTFYGALKAWCENIEKLRQTEGFENKEFIVITPLITSWNVSMGSKRDWNQSKLNVHGHTLRQYCTAIMEVCTEYDIPVFDANMFSGIYYNSPEDNNVELTGGDGVHISAAGHALLAESLSEFLLGGYSYEERTVTDCGHNFEADITEPTCTEGGFTTYRCPKCHYKFDADYTEATGHTEVIDKAVAPTCTETGLTEGKHCSVCGEILVAQEIVPATGHNYESAITEPTCTEQGYTTHTCSVCGDSYVDSYVEASGHTEVIDKAVAPTCTETGLTEGKHCSVCGEVLVAQEIVPATGHNYESVITEPTCTEQGYTTYTCSVCGDSYVDSYVEATGHSFGEWYTVTEATPTEPGEERRDCENCEHYETQEIPPKGYEIGDINLDGKVDVMDAYYIRLVVAKLRKPTEQQIILGDVDGDGKITAIDANIIRKFAIKMIETLPVQ